MSFAINNTQTVWLPFNTSFSAIVTIFASWNEQVVVSDPNGLTGFSSTGTGTPSIPTTLGTFTTPNGYGNLPAYPVNVQITNNNGQGPATSPNFVMGQGWAVTSFDQLSNGGHNNLWISFQPNS